MNKLYNGEALEIMDMLIMEGVEVDAIITDPPYGTITNLKTDGWKDTDNSWDIAIKPEDIYSRANQLLKQSGRLILFSQEPYTSELRHDNDNNLPLSSSLIWKKNNHGNPFLAKKAPLYYHEDISVFTKKYDIYLKNPIREYSKYILNSLGMTLKEVNEKLGHRRAEHFFYHNTLQFKLCTEKTYDELIDIFNIDKLTHFKNYDELLMLNNKYRQTFNTDGVKSSILDYPKDGNNYHPTQKPVALMEDLVTTYTNEGDTILDFTMGSGSTGVACKNTNRDFIGIELNEKYYNIAKKRIE